MRNLIYPENLPDLPRKGRAAKDWTVIASKPKPQVQYFHCRIHKGIRLLPGYICPIGCGPTMPAIRVVDTNTKNKKTKLQVE